MRKIIKAVSLLLAALLAFSLCACGKPEAEETYGEKVTKKPKETTARQTESTTAPEHSETEPESSAETGEEPRYATVAIKDAKAGDVIVFGSYEQDGDVSNGKEPLEWLVLSKDGNSLLVITLYGIERMQFHNSLSHVTWETSDVRAWLNGDFIGAAFSPEESAAIETTHVTAEANPNYPKSPAGGDTDDKVFLLSVQEAEMYFEDDASRRCAPTDAVLNGSSVYSHTGKPAWYANSDYICNWWLRSPGMYKDLYVSYVEHGGRESGGGQVYLEGTDTCVRPAMRIKIG